MSLTYIRIIHREAEKTEMQLVPAPDTPCMGSASVLAQGEGVCVSVFFLYILLRVSIYIYNICCCVVVFCVVAVLRGVLVYISYIIVVFVCSR